MKRFLALCVLLPTAALAAAVATVTHGDWPLYRGTAIVSRHATEAACIAAAKALGVERSYTCRTTTTVAVTIKTDQPVDCVVSAWSAYIYTPWTVPGTVETRTGTRTRTVTTPASNGGAACPALTETVTESRPYTPPAPTATLTVTPLTLPAGGGNATATWSCTGAAAALTLDGQSLSTAKSGTLSGNISSTSTVRLTCDAQTIDRQIVVGSTQPPVTGNGTATLTWGAPTQYVDGSAILAGDITGYQVYHGTSASALSPLAFVQGLTYQATGLLPGTHYFAVSTLAGAESAQSEIRSKTTQ